MKFSLPLIFCSIICLTICSSLLAVDISKHPSRREWRYFLGNSVQSQANIWKTHKQLGVEFSDWSWGWRILWVKSCGLNRAGYCQKILQLGFKDRALVVRAETISQLGRRFKGTGDRQILQKLQQAASQRWNFRNQRPLFIHDNILRAVQEIGGVKSALYRQLKQRYHL